MTKALTVSQINSYIKTLIEDDIILSDILLEAEISNFKLHSSGNVYFTLKDEHAAISCVMFKFLASTIDFELHSGLCVIVYGKVLLYEKSGQYQLCVEYIQAIGDGVIDSKLSALKDKLSAEGLFDVRYKKTLPKFPNRIAVITSGTGAVIHDITTTAYRRNKLVEIITISTAVQGKNALQEIILAIDKANTLDVDVIIIARGGGSSEDLSVFNEELLARAIFSSKIPIVSAIGHETDYTIADYVADVRAATPTAAAELIIPDVESIKGLLDIKKHILETKMLEQINKRKQIIRYANDLLNEKFRRRIAQKKFALQNKFDKLEKLSPVNVLKRGYAVVNGGKVCFSDLAVSNRISIKFYDGEVLATIINIKEQKLNGEEERTIT